MRKKLIEIIGLVSCLLILFAFGSKNPSSEIAGASLLQFIPEESHYVVYGNLNSIRKSTFFKNDIDEFREKFKMDINEKDKKREYLRFIEETGFNIEEDVYEFAAGGISAEIESKEDVIVVINAEANSDKISNYITSHKKNKGETKIKKTSFKNVDLFKVTNKGEKAFVIANPKAEIWIVGKEEIVKSAISQSSSILDNKSISDKIKSLEHRDFYSVFSTNALRKKLPEENKFKGHLELVNMISFGIEVNETLHIKFQSESTREADAKELYQVMNGMVSLSRLLMSAERELIDLMNEIELDQDGNTISLEVELSKERLDKLKNYKNKFKGLGH